MVQVSRENSDLLMEVSPLKVELNTVMIMYGALSAMTFGRMMMLLWCVGSLVSLPLVSKINANSYFDHGFHSGMIEK